MAAYNLYKTSNAQMLKTKRAEQAENLKSLLTELLTAFDNVGKNNGRNK